MPTTKTPFQIQRGVELMVYIILKFEMLVSKENNAKPYNSNINTQSETTISNKNAPKSRNKSRELLLQCATLMSKEIIPVLYRS